ncbi:YcjF family protein [Magnetospirillum molischianum]|uniref:GTPase domain-containing protein n=1 Tax=Magnetospirillum molischianum DSM 120 TaxID=1150626 RepID=H8FVW5_MAGML|nr:DUF697 domain-containing protein [Magnetospirillum molischianum]CCG42503.1 conserved hypothetical protein [Magnetospirillum molischianum DSM 120]
MSEKVSESSAPSDVANEGEDEHSARKQRVEHIARNHILASLGVGLVPIPIADIVGVLAVNLDLIKSLSKEYGVPFEQDRGKAILTSLLGGLFPVAVGGTVISLLKFIPIVGQTTGAVALPILAGAATYAVNKVFVRHYEAGGSIFDLDTTRVKDYFSKQFRLGKKVAADLKDKEPSAAA